MLKSNLRDPAMQPIIERIAKHYFSGAKAADLTRLKVTLGRSPQFTVDEMRILDSRAAARNSEPAKNNVMFYKFIFSIDWVYDQMKNLVEMSRSMDDDDQNPAFLQTLKEYVAPLGFNKWDGQAGYIERPNPLVIPQALGLPQAGGNAVLVANSFVHTKFALWMTALFKGLYIRNGDQADMPAFYPIQSDQTGLAAGIFNAGNFDDEQKQGMWIVQDAAVNTEPFTSFAKAFRKANALAPFINLYAELQQKLSTYVDYEYNRPDMKADEAIKRAMKRNTRLAEGCAPGFVRRYRDREGNPLPDHLAFTWDPVTKKRIMSLRNDISQSYCDPAIVADGGPPLGPYVPNYRAVQDAANANQLNIYAAAAQAFRRPFDSKIQQNLKPPAHYGAQVLDGRFAHPSYGAMYLKALSAGHSGSTAAYGARHRRRRSHSSRAASGTKRKSTRRSSTKSKSGASKKRKSTSRKSTIGKLHLTKTQLVTLKRKIRKVAAKLAKSAASANKKKHSSSTKRKSHGPKRHKKTSTTRRRVHRRVHHRSGR